MITITAIAYTAYPVTDIARARVFYEEVLGLKPTETFGEGSQQWIEYDVGGATIAISNMAADKWKPSPDGPGLAFEVADFEAAMATLKAAGVRFYLEPTESPVGRLAAVSDPDGNSVLIHRRNAP